jgi:hypothetical protein
MYKECGRPHITKVELEPPSSTNTSRRADILVRGAAVPFPPSVYIDVTIASLASAKCRAAIAAAGPVSAKNGDHLVQAALAVRFADKRRSYQGVRLNGKFAPFVLSAEGALHSVAQSFLQTLTKFKLGAIVRRFCILLSCSLLRERAVTYYI